MSDVLVTAGRVGEVLLTKQAIAGKVVAASIAVPDDTEAVISSDIDSTDAADTNKHLTLVVEVAVGGDVDGNLSWETISVITWQGYAGSPWKGATRDLATTIDLAPYAGKRIRCSLESASLTSGATIGVK